MGQIEEITNDAESKLKLSESNSNKAASPAPSASASSTAAVDAPPAAGPALPPERAALSGKTTEEILADLNSSPLFMTELEENDDVAALQALAYEGTPWENASGFKDRGNECFRAHRWADAREFYAKSIAVLAAEERRRTRGEPPAPGSESTDDPAEARREAELLAQLYSNRAACHLELRNFRSCTLDGAAALRIDPRAVKALYRSARALLALTRLGEADDACTRGLAIEPANSALLALRGEIARKRDEVDARRRADDERRARDLRRRRLLAAALAARGIRTRRTDKPPEMEDAGLRLVPDPDDPTSSLTFPVVLLYPADLQSDFIKAFGERDSLADHLSYVLPPPWDTKKEYASPAAVECFVETRRGGLAKVGKKMSLLRVLGAGGADVEVVDEIVRFFVLPRARADAWVAEFKAKKAAERGGEGEA